MDEQFETIETTEAETFDDYETTESSTGSGLIGALIGGAVVAVGAAAVNAVRKNEKVKNFVESRKEARRQKAMHKWLEHGIKAGYIGEDEIEEEAK